MIGPVVGHVGTRVSALVDGQLPSDVADRLWAHVHCCPMCREQVEREGWVKTRLVALSQQARPAPDYLTSLLALGPLEGDLAEEAPTSAASRRRAAAVVVGAGSVGAAVLGVLAVAGPAVAPDEPRRTPVADFSGPSAPAEPVQPISSSTPGSVPDVDPSAATAARVFLGAALTNEWVTISK